MYMSSNGHVVLNLKDLSDEAAKRAILSLGTDLGRALVALLPVSLLF
jgi:hypothetical protein